MARRAKEEAERTRTRILASALALFAKKGYAQTTFTDVAALLARHTAQMLDHAEARAYFQLLHRQIQWTDSSMAAVRRDLLTNRRFGPWEAFRAAL